MPNVTVYSRISATAIPTATLTISELGGLNSYTTWLAPKKITYDSDTGKYNEVARPYRKPLLVKEGSTLRRMKMTLFIGSTNIEASVVDSLAALERLANSDYNLAVAYDNRTAGQWRITKLTYDSVERSAWNNEITRADADIEFTQMPEAQTYAPPGGGGGGGGRTYVIVKKDTLKKIIKKNYPTVKKAADRARLKSQIKSLNPQVTNWNKLKPGTTIKLPY